MTILKAAVFFGEFHARCLFPSPGFAPRSGAACSHGLKPLRPLLDSSDNNRGGGGGEATDTNSSSQKKEEGEERVNATVIKKRVQ